MRGLAFLELMGDFLLVTGLDGGTTIPGHGEVGVVWLYVRLIRSTC